VEGVSTPMERMHALDHLSPLQAAKAWGVPKDALRNAAEQIRQIRAGADRSLARDRPRCPAPVTSFYGFPCKVPVEAGMELCYQHRRTEHRDDADLLTYTLAAVQAHESWEALHNRITKLDKRALERERHRLLQALAGHTPLHEEDYRLAAMVLPSDDPATQERRALGLPGPNDGIGDGARLRGLGVLLAAARLVPRAGKPTPVPPEDAPSAPAPTAVAPSAHAPLTQTAPDEESEAVDHPVGRPKLQVIQGGVVGRLRDSNPRPTHYETMSDHVAWCRVVPPRDVLPDQSMCGLLSRVASCCTIQRRPATGWPPEAAPLGTRGGIRPVVDLPQGLRQATILPARPIPARASQAPRRFPAGSPSGPSARRK
jgi:hypothetical protein